LKLSRWLGVDSIQGSAGLASNPLTVLVIQDGVTLQAVYTTQYRFTIKDFADNSVYESWYDSGSTAKFVQPDKVKNTVPMDGFLGALGGLWRLRVWLDNDQPISPDSDITVNV
jgi:hypothetical protein